MDRLAEIEQAVLAERNRCLGIIRTVGHACYTEPDFVAAHPCSCWRGQLEAAVLEP